MATLFGKLSGSHESGDLRQDIARDLGWLLNNRRGTCCQNREYGLPHLSELGPLPEAEQHLLAEIERTVQAFEPRVAGLVVAPVPAEERPCPGVIPMCFVMSGEVRSDRSRGTYRTDLQINHDSRVRVGRGG